jgi:hypothetical protein
VTQALLSKFKELIVTRPKLLRGLHSMSMLKMVPEGLKARECEQIKLRELPPVPYVPVKDDIQDEVARMRSMDQDYVGKGYHIELCCVARKWDSRSFFDARDCRAQCN